MSRSPFMPWRRAAAALLAGAVVAVACGDDPGTEASVDPPSSDPWTAFEEYLAGQDDFSGAVLVSRDGEELVATAAGLADRAEERPNEVDTRFNLGSVSKMFTGVAVAQLVEDGELSFDDTVGDHLAGFPAEIADVVTVDHLLTHTSGMGDFAAGGYPETAKEADTATDLLPLIVDQPLLFTPGSREGYSNSGYAVLGAIVEAVSGQSYDDYVGEHILTPAGMTDTDWAPPIDPGPDTATGYTAAGATSPPGAGPGGGAPGIVTLPPRGGGNGGGAPGTVTLPPPGPGGTGGGAREDLVDNRDIVPWGNPSGGAYSTVRDLARFARALLGHELLGPEMTDTVTTGKVDMASGSARVAYGFTDGATDGVRIVGHGGGAPGVSASVDIFPDLGYVVVVLANRDGVSEPVHEHAREVVASTA